VEQDAKFTFFVAVGILLPYPMLMATVSHITGSAFEARVERLLGGHGSTARMARALGRHPSHLHRIFSGKRPVPNDLMAIVELLEVTPREKWPERWE
jgi:lambda repressor-like predicted transcriptional regulator